MRRRKEGGRKGEAVEVREEKRIGGRRQQK